MKSTERRIAELDCTVVDTPGCEDEIRAIVVICHGFAASGRDLVPVAPELYRADPAGLAGVRFVFPMAPIEMDEFGDYDARAWWPIDMLRLQQMMESGEIRDLRNDRPNLLEQRYDELVEMIGEVQSEAGLNNSKTIVGGFSQGAMLATEVALRSEPQVAGLIVWSGSLLSEDSWRKHAAQRKDLRVVQTHGRIDPILPYIGAEWLKELLTESGQEVTFASFNGPHTIPPAGITMATELIASVAGK